MWGSLRLAPTSDMQGIGAGLTLHCVAQGVLFALHVVDFEYTLLELGMGNHAACIKLYLTLRVA